MPRFNPEGPYYTTIDAYRAIWRGTHPDLPVDKRFPIDKFRVGVKIYPMKNIVQYKIIGRGKASWHADAGTVEHGNIGYNGGGTYTTKESSSGGTLAEYAREAVEGCFVYDAEGADDNAFIGHVYNGPMVDVDLRAGCIRRALSNVIEFTFIGEEKPHSIDHVSLDVFEGLLRQIPGMKFGKVVKGRVVWEDPAANEPVADNHGSADC
jgi:hypothetical protein